MSKTAKSRTAYKSVPRYLTGSNKNCSWSKFFPDLVQSERFQSMSNPAKLLYWYCRAQNLDSTARASLRKHADEESKLLEMDFSYWYENGSPYFVFPEAHCEKYGITGAYRSKYMKELIENGFVQIVEQNKHRFRDRKENVYMLSGLWLSEKKDIPNILKTAKGERTADDVAKEIKAEMDFRRAQNEIPSDEIPELIPF